MLPNNLKRCLPLASLSYSELAKTFSIYPWFFSFFQWQVFCSFIVSDPVFLKYPLFQFLKNCWKHEKQNPDWSDGSLSMWSCDFCYWIYQQWGIPSLPFLTLGCPCLYSPLNFCECSQFRGCGLLCEKGGSGHVLGLVACRMGQAYQPCTVKDVFWSSSPTVSVMVSEQCLCLRSAAVSSALDKRGELIPSRLSYPSWDSALLISPWDLKLERCWWDISALPGILVTL